MMKVVQTMANINVNNRLVHSVSIKSHSNILFSAVLQSKLTTLALYIGYIGEYSRSFRIYQTDFCIQGMSAAFLTLICLIVRYCITTYIVNGEKASGSDVGYFISFLIQAITVVVVSVPEGSLHFFRRFDKTNQMMFFLDGQVFHWLSHSLWLTPFELVISN